MMILLVAINIISILVNSTQMLFLLYSGMSISDIIWGIVECTISIAKAALIGLICLAVGIVCYKERN